ncbi:hypothetical protein NB689_001395 [Xanthomonas sacchari]|nr:hypothetical protein [Xanthomonas sacchari]
MQIAALALELDLHGVGALVAGVAGMQRLLHVAGEMHHELQRLRTRGLRLAAVGEDRGLAAQRFDRAVAVRTVAGLLVVAVVLCQVDVVPARAALAQIGIVFAELVGPVGDAGQGRVGFALQQGADLRAGLRGELGVGEIGDQAVTQRAPGEGGGRCGGEGRGERGANEGRDFHAPILAGADDAAMTRVRSVALPLSTADAGARRRRRPRRAASGDTTRLQAQKYIRYATP